MRGDRPSVRSVRLPAGYRRQGATSETISRLKLAAVGSFFRLRGPSGEEMGFLLCGIFGNAPLRCSGERGQA